MTLHAEGLTLAIIVASAMLNIGLLALVGWLYGRVRELMQRVANVERFAENENPNLYARIKRDAAGLPGVATTAPTTARV